MTAAKNLGARPWSPGKLIGEFRTPDKKEFIGFVYKKSVTEWLIGRRSDSCHNHFEFLSAPFHPSEFKVVGSWGGVVEYSAK